MFQRILVPLDGSARAEQAIPVAARIARAAGGSVILLRVDTAPIDFAWQRLESPLVMPDALVAEHDTIAQYLGHLAASKTLEGIGIATVVADGVPARVILSIAQERQADLIVLCSHGYGGMTRWMLGSVAQKVAHQSAIPVLILHEGAGLPPDLHPEGQRSVRVMVPLDGSRLAEAALAPAAYLSMALSAPLPGLLHLVQVLPFLSQANMAYDKGIAARIDSIVVNAQAYLKATEQRVQAEEGGGNQLEVHSSLIYDPDIASALIRLGEHGQEAREAQETPDWMGDVIVMATHGRGGLERWALGSITERVLDHTRLPLLILHPRSQGDQSQEPGGASRVKHEKSTDAGMRLTNLP